MHLCAELIAASMMLEPLGEVGANFSLQLSLRTQFTKINNKKVIAENQCEKKIEFKADHGSKYFAYRHTLDPGIGSKFQTMPFSESSHVACQIKGN